MNWKGQAFVPFALLSECLERAVLTKVFQECGIQKYQEDEAIEAVLSSGRRVFGILNAIGEESSTLLFKKNADGFLNKTPDSGLPYDQVFLESILPEVYEKFYQLQWKYSFKTFLLTERLRKWRE